MPIIMFICFLIASAYVEWHLKEKTRIRVNILEIACLLLSLFLRFSVTESYKDIYDLIILSASLRLVTKFALYRSSFDSENHSLD